MERHCDLGLGIDLGLACLDVDICDLQTMTWSSAQQSNEVALSQTEPACLHRETVMSSDFVL